MSLTRREILTALLGSSLLGHGCGRRPRSVPGSIIGARMELGHRLLDATVERVDVPAERVEVLIVGAGPSGLAAARRLERGGVKNYRVLELESRAGGTSASSREGVVAYPWGAHYVPVPGPEQPELVAVLEELGAVERGPSGAVVAAERARVRAPEERLFVDGAWIEGLFPSSRAGEADHAELARFEREIAALAAFRDAEGRPAFTLPMRKCSDAAEVVQLDRLSASAWLDQRGFRSRLLRWYVEYACRDDYGASLERTSAWAMLFYFCARLGGVTGETAPFLTWPEGNGRIVDHLVRKVGDRLRLHQLVTDIVPSADGVEVVAYDASRRAALRYLADDVIVATPKFVAHRLVRPLREDARAATADFHYAPWLVANLHLRERPRSQGFPFAWDNVLFDSPSLGYVVATHQELADFGPSVWTYYRPFWEQSDKAARQLIRALDHATAVEAVLTDLGRAHRGLERAVERVDVMVWGHGMVTPTPGFIWGPQRRKAAQAVGRVVFAHSDCSGLALLEEAFDCGVGAAESALRARGMLG